MFLIMWRRLVFHEGWPRNKMGWVMERVLGVNEPQVLGIPEAESEPYITTGTGETPLLDFSSKPSTAQFKKAMADWLLVFGIHLSSSAQGTLSLGSISHIWAWRGTHLTNHPCLRTPWWVAETLVWRYEAPPTWAYSPDPHLTFQEAICTVWLRCLS